MKRIVAGKVVIAIGRANAFVAVIEGHLESAAAEIVRQAEGKREISHRRADGRLQLFAGHHHLVVQFAFVGNAAQIGVGARVCADFNSLLGHPAKLSHGVGAARYAAAQIVRKRLALQNVPQTYKVRAGNFFGNQQRQGAIAIVGIAVVEGDAGGDAIVAAAADALLRFFQRDQIAMLFQPANLPAEQAVRMRPRRCPIVGDAVIEQHQDGRFALCAALAIRPAAIRLRETAICRSAADDR